MQIYYNLIKHKMKGIKSVLLFLLYVKYDKMLVIIGKVL